MDEYEVGKYYVATLLTKAEILDEIGSEASEDEDIITDGIRYLNRFKIHAEHSHFLLLKYEGNKRFSFHNALIHIDWLINPERIHLGSGDL